METKVDAIIKPDCSKSSRQTLYMSQVQAGFPSPADDYQETKLDLNQYMVKNPAATYFVRVSGDSMIGAGIHPGDLLVVDRSIEPRNKKIVIANINGELTVKRFRVNRKKMTLEPENKDYPVHEINDEMQFEIWGVVTNVIHPL